MVWINLQKNLLEQSDEMWLSSLMLEDPYMYIIVSLLSTSGKTKSAKIDSGTNFKSYKNCNPKKIIPLFNTPMTEFNPIELLREQ